MQAKSAVEAILSRALKNATVVPGPGVQGGFEMLKTAKADVFAANKSILFEMSDQLPGSRVLPGNYATESQATARCTTGDQETRCSLRLLLLARDLTPRSTRAVCQRIYARQQTAGHRER